MKSLFYQLMLVTDPNMMSRADYLQFIKICVNVGITSVQLREKYLPFEQQLLFGKQLQSILNPKRIPLIVNDSLKLAIALDADGLHLGQEDGSIFRARKQLGYKKILGLSINSIDELKQANKLPLDYVSVGAIFKTLNKKNIKTIWGIDGLKKACIHSTHPVIAIGGINEYNAIEVMQSGAKGIAAIGVFHTTKNLTKTLQTLKEAIQ